MAALTVALTCFAIPAKANLILAGGLFTDSPGDTAAREASLESQFNTGSLTFLGRYSRDPNTGAALFFPGAISDPSLLSYTPTSPGGGFVSWDLTGTGFQNTWVVTLFSGSDFDSDVAFRVTRDELLNSRGPQPLPGSPIDFFGTLTNVPDMGSTALLLASALTGLWIMHRLERRHPGERLAFHSSD